jgi:ferric-dicitrate binding protein FerR (iron transport regulator)
VEQWLLPGADRRMLDHILKIRALQPELGVRKIRVWPRIVAAASIALAIGVGSLIYFNRHTRHTNEIVYKNDVAPGTQGATLTLANGRKIRLSDAANGELAREAGVVIDKSKDGQLLYRVASESTNPDKVNTLSTANGETYQLVLPDGSHVWLNSASSLTYSASLLKEGRRSVKLSGEGYFEVVKDKAHPFVVEAAGQQVEVLGTHFNVNSYGDEPAVATTLLEGSVKVSEGAASRMIVPGEQAVNKGGQISVAKVNTERVIDWKQGEFNLESEDLRSAMRKIARWYNVEVIYDPSVPQNLEAGGWIPRNSKLSSILRLIENTGIVHFRIEGRKVYVFK